MLQSTVKGGFKMRQKNYCFVTGSYNGVGFSMWGFSDCDSQTSTGGQGSLLWSA